MRLFKKKPTEMKVTVLRGNDVVLVHNTGNAYRVEFDGLVMLPIKKLGEK